MATAVAAIVVARQRRIVEALRHADATAPERACRPESIGLDPDAHQLARLRTRAIVHATPDGALWVDLARWQERRDGRRRVVLGVLVGVLAALAIAQLLGAFASRAP